MSTNLLHAHNLLNAHRHEQRKRNRALNMRVWVTNINPALGNTTAASYINTGYLADLYPNIWRWGPHGDTLSAQLTHVEMLLDQIVTGYAYADFEIDAEHVFHATVAANHAFENRGLIDILNQHAATTGLPLPGDEILGIDQREPGNQPSVTQWYNLITHPLWQNRLDGSGMFEDFLYRFSLITIHRDFYTALAFDNPTIQGVLDDHTDFCARWEIPR